MKLYVIVQNYEPDFEYSWDYSPYELCKAFYTEDEAKQTKEEWESENGGEIWQENDFNCYYTISEITIDSVKPVEDPNLIKGGWIGRETECCGYCGNNLRLTAKFCDRCGREVNREELTKKHLRMKL